MKKRGGIWIILAIVIIFVMLSFHFVLGETSLGKINSKKTTQTSSFLLVKLNKDITFDKEAGFIGADEVTLSEINTLNQQYGTLIEKSSPKFFSSRVNQKLKEKYGEEGWYKVTFKDKKALSKLYHKYKTDKSFLFVRKVYLRRIYLPRGVS